MLRIHSLRFRIAAAYILGTLVVSGAVALATYLITSSVLARRAIEDAKAQTFDQLTFLTDQLKLNDDRGRLRGYLQTLQQRGASLIAKTEGFQNAESTSIGISEGQIPKRLRDQVRRGCVGYAIFGERPNRSLVFGSPVPGEARQGACGFGVRTISTYFIYPLESIDRTLALLWRVLLGVVAFAAAVAGAVGLRLADRTIRPLRVAADAARKVAAGGLGTRLETVGEDELGSLTLDFNRMTEALEQTVNRERQFIDDVSHDLRTPVTTLKTSIDFIAARGEELPPAVRKMANLAAEQVTSMHRLVDNLLELTRADAGGIQMTVDDVDLRKFASEIARRRAPDTTVEIEGPQTLVVRTDQMKLERVVGNLLENAVVHGGGEAVRISLEQLDGAARISVTDQGPGIPEAQLPRIFERFWRGDEARSRDTGVGSGLGLAIAHENAKLLGADLAVYSAQGHGTRFELVLPRGTAA